MMLRLRTIAFVAVALYAVPALAVISGSKHDFRGATWNDNNTICEPCHTPHRARLAGTDPNSSYPLWNHSNTAVANFTLYSSGTMDAAVGQPSHWSSKLCLSCHDGTVALDSFGRNADGTPHVEDPGTKLLPTNEGYIGTDLSTEHPVQFLYSEADAADDEIRSASDTSRLNTGGATIAEYYTFDGFVGCASCHDVHNTTGWGKMLRGDPSESKICLDCHIK